MRLQYILGRMRSGTDALVRDTRYAVRRLVRDWRFTAAAVLILGSRHRRQHRDLQPRQRDAVPPAAVGRSRSPRRHLSERHQRRRRRCELVSGLPGHGGVHRRLREHDRRVRPSRRELSGRGRLAAGDRRAHHRDLSVRAGTPAVARPLVQRRGGHARRRGRRRRRAPGVDEEVSRGSVRDRPDHPDRRRAGDDRRRRSRRPPRHHQHRPRHRLLAADFGAPDARRAAAHPGAAAGGGGVLREGPSARWRDRRAGAGGDAHSRQPAGGRVPEGGSGQGHRGVRVERRAHPSADGRPVDGGRVAAARASSASCWPSRAATWRRCCWCAGPRARRRCRSGWPWARRADSSFVTC